MINDGDIVVGGIGYIGKLFPYGNGIGTCATNHFSILHGLSYLMSRFKFFDHLVVVQVYSKNTHGIRMQRTPQSWDLSSFHFGTLYGFLGVVPIGVMGNH